MNLEARQSPQRFSNPLHVPRRVSISRSGHDQQHGSRCLGRYCLPVKHQSSLACSSCRASRIHRKKPKAGQSQRRFVQLTRPSRRYAQERGMSLRNKRRIGDCSSVSSASSAPKPRSCWLILPIIIICNAWSSTNDALRQNRCIQNPEQRINTTPI
jgi:hypothetical protein